MDQLKLYSFFILIASLIQTSKLLAEESENFEVELIEKSGTFGGRIGNKSEDAELKVSEQFRSKGREHFNCDLLLTPEQERSLYHSVSQKDADEFRDLYIWQKNKEGKAIVPYRISKKSKFTPDQLRTIRFAMDAIERETCVRFQPRKTARDFVNIVSGEYCRSHLGRIGGAQDISLNKGKCVTKGIVIHELLHALGSIHMHNRPNRDKYVKILWKNIDPKFRDQFDRVNPHFNYLGTPYDLRSIMHYGSRSASRNGELTIVPKDGANVEDIGQRDGLSDGDIKRINTKYTCKDGNSFSTYSESEDVDDEDGDDENH